MSDKKELIQLTGLWSKKDKKGRTFLTGRLGSADIVIFRNDYKKEGSKQPDYRIYLSAHDFSGNQSDLEDSDDALEIEVQNIDDLPPF